MFGFAAYVIAKVIHDIGTEIIFLKFFGHEPIKYRTPKNGKHMYQYLRIESYLNPLSKRDTKQFPKIDLGFAAGRNRNSLHF